MALNWAKDKSRRLAHSARQAELDAARYVNEAHAIIREPREGRTPRIAILKCTCGHRGSITTARGQRFKCSVCGKIWHT